MGRVSKEKALEKLTGLKEKINELKPTGSGFSMTEGGEISFDDEVLVQPDSWKRDVASSINYYFRGRPNEKYYREKLKTVDFSIMGHETGMAVAHELIAELMKEIDEYW